MRRPKKVYSLKAINIMMIIAMVLGGVVLDFGSVKATAGDITITAPSTPEVVAAGDSMNVAFTVDSTDHSGAGQYRILVGEEVFGPYGVTFTGGVGQPFARTIVIPAMADGSYDLKVEVNFLGETGWPHSATAENMVVVNNVDGIEITAPTEPVYVKAGDLVDVVFTVDYLQADTTPGSNDKYTITVGTTDVLTVAAVPYDGGYNQLFEESISIPGSLGDGPHDLKVTASDFNGDSYVGTIVGAIIVDDTLPATPVLDSPNGGEAWAIGSSQTISWETYDPGETVTIDLYFSANGGGAWSKIADNVPNADYTWTVPAAATTTAQIKVEVTDAVGNIAADTSAGNFTIYAVDSSAPAVAMLAPADGAIVGDPVGLEASASDPESGIAEVLFQYYDESGSIWTGIAAGVFDGDSYNLSWNSGLSGDVEIRAKATNGIGLVAFSETITVTIQQEDETPPEVTLDAPIDGAVVGYDYEFLVTASDAESGLASLEIFAVAKAPGLVFDTKLCDLTLTEVPGQFSCTADVPAGTEQIKAVVKDVAGNENTDSADVVVDLTAPVLGAGLTTPADNAVLELGSSVDITWAAITEDHLDHITLELRKGGAVIATIADPWMVAGPPAADYAVCMVVVDAAGNSAEDCNSPITIWGTDTTLPLVNLTAPLAGNYKGTISLTATASDDQTFIQKVEFFVDGVKVGEDLDAPYELSWDSTTVADGMHVLKAKATNGVGLMAEFINFNIVIDNTAPVLSNMLPTTAAPIFGTVAFSVVAVDAGVDGITLVFEYFDGTDYVTITEPTNFNTTTVPDGWLEVRVTATDLLGNESTLTSNYLVQNGEPPAPGEGALISLQTGWNLISLPLVPNDPAIATFLSDLVAHESVIQVVAWPFEVDTIHEKRWNGVSLLDISEMVDGVGYWVEMSKPDVLSFDGAYLPEPPAAPPSYIVYAGWNLIGYKSQDPTHTAAEYLGEAGGANMKAMYGFDESTGVYEQILAESTLTPGNGYWLAVSTNATIYPPAE